MKMFTVDAMFQIGEDASGRYVMFRPDRKEEEQVVHLYRVDAIILGSEDQPLLHTTLHVLADSPKAAESQATCVLQHREKELIGEGGIESSKFVVVAEQVDLHIRGWGKFVF